MKFKTFFRKFIEEKNLGKLKIPNKQYQQHITRIKKDYGLIHVQNHVMILTNQLPTVKWDNFAKEYYYTEIPINDLLKKYEYNPNQKHKVEMKLWNKYGVLRWNISGLFFRKPTNEELDKMKKEVYGEPLQRSFVTKIINKHLKGCEVNRMRLENEIRLEQDKPNKKELYKEHLIKKRIEIHKQRLLKQLKKELKIMEE